MENQTTKKSTMIHKENEWEWKFVGIWADMIKDTGLAEKLKNFPASETLILFKPYEKPLEIIQENLRLRNQYNQLKSGGKKDDVKVMEDAIQKHIENLPFSPELCIYSFESDNCLKI
jgi:hypothetical protein